MLATYSFENNASIQIAIIGDVDTAEAIAAVEQLLAMKKQELAALPTPPRASDAAGDGGV